MRILTSLLGCVVFLALGVPFPAAASEVEGHFSKAVTRNVTYKYLIILPDDFQPTRSYPLVLFLHGSGERGDNLSLVKKQGPFKAMADAKAQAILVAPQCPKNEWWTPEVLAGLLDQVEKDYPIDRSRIYLTGLSLGGYGVWALATYQPDRFAALAPICGGGEPAEAAKLAKVPIWAFHGDQDKAVTLDKGQAMIDAVQAAGGAPKFTIYPGVGHDSWTATYQNPEFYEWLFAQKRSDP